MRLSTSRIPIQWRRSMGVLLPLLVGSVLITLLATAAGPTSGGGLLQSPVSPIGPSPGPTSSGWLFQSPVSPIGPSPGESPAAPQATVTGPALVSVPAVPNLVPWMIGLLIVVALVGVAVWWRRRKEEGGTSQ